MGINSHIDYIDDPNDTFDEYLEKARRYGFRCVFADPETYEHACEMLAGTDVIVAGASTFPRRAHARGGAAGIRALCAGRVYGDRLRAESARRG